VRFVGGKRRKGQHKSKAVCAAAKKKAAAMKKKGAGIFKPVSCSAALSAVTGIKGKTTRGQIFKALWVHIKSPAKIFVSACNALSRQILESVRGRS
jgi:hypothetical protein